MSTGLTVRYIFSFIERSTLSARFRLNYAFTPSFTVEGYATRADGDNFLVAKISYWFGVT